MSALVAVSVGLTAGRFYLHRKSSSRALRWSDYSCGVAALVCTAAIVYLIVTAYATVQDTKSAPTTSSQRIFFGQGDFLTSLIFWLDLYLVKTSVLMLFWSLFAVSRNFRRAWWTVTTFAVSMFLATLVSLLWTNGSPQYLFSPRMWWRPSIYHQAVMTANKWYSHSKPYRHVEHC